jgi:hypothetical protein
MENEIEEQDYCVEFSQTLTTHMYVWAKSEEEAIEKVKNWDTSLEWKGVWDHASDMEAPDNVRIIG